MPQFLFSRKPRAAVIEHGARAVAVTPRKYPMNLELTVQENKILDMMIEECPGNRDIALRFGISEETVKRHLSNMMDKTGYSTRTELVVRTIQKRAAMERPPIRCSCSIVKDVHPQACEREIPSSSLLPAEFHIYDQPEALHCLARSTQSMDHAWYLAGRLIVARREGGMQR